MGMKKTQRMYSQTSHKSWPVSSVRGSVQETYKARGVVIPHSLGVAKGLQQGIGTDDLVLQSPLQKNTKAETQGSPGLPERPAHHDSHMPIRPTCILPEVGSSFFFSPVTAIVAKYWMTRFVFTVFPAPDSPLSNKNQVSSGPKASSYVSHENKASHLLTWSGLTGSLCL